MFGNGRTVTEGHKDLHVLCVWEKTLRCVLLENCKINKSKFFFTGTQLNLSSFGYISMQ